MIKHLLTVAFAVAPFLQAPGQAPPKVVNVCVAQIRNQTTAKLDLAKLREALLTELQSTGLAKDRAVTFLPIEADSSDTAKEALQKSQCEYAVYTRILRKPKEQRPAGWDSGTTVIVSKTEKTEFETYGLQCTVERALTGMPILIDRQFDTQPASAEKAVPKLLSNESTRIAEALTKKLVQ